MCAPRATERDPIRHLPRCACCAMPSGAYPLQVLTIQGWYNGSVLDEHIRQLAGSHRAFLDAHHGVGKMRRMVLRYTPDYGALVVAVTEPSHGWYNTWGVRPPTDIGWPPAVRISDVLLPYEIHLALAASQRTCRPRST